MVTKENYKFLKLPLFYSIFLIYMELSFILFTFGKIDWKGFISCFLFSISVGVFLTLISSFFSPKVNKRITIILVCIITLIFISQLIYYNIYLSIFSIYSVANGSTQVMEFWRKILDVTLSKSFHIILFILPLGLFLKFGLKLIHFQKTNIRLKAIFTGMLVVSYLGGISLLLIPDDDIYSTKRLYFNTHSPSLSTKKLGLMTAMRLDIKYELFGADSFENQQLLNQQGSKNSEQTAADSTAIVDIPEEIVEIIEYNTLDIDFDTLIKKETDETVKNMHQYFKIIEPTKKNEYTGLFEGKNLVLVLAESFTPLAIDKELTPTLYKMANESYKFTNFYTPIWPVSTSDGEYMTCTSLIPKEGVWSMAKSSENYLPFVMGNLMLDKGYNTFAYHNHSHTYYKRNLSHPNMGYQTFKAVGNGLKIKKTWPESDLEMINVTVNEYMDSNPFLAYYVTVSGHLEYNKYNAMALKNWSHVDDLEYSTAAKAYLSCNIELDRALEALINHLEEEGIADDTVIALSGDHYPYGLTVEEMSELKGHPIEENFEMYENTFLIYNKDVEPVTIDKPASSMDILPTLANLFGLEYDSRLLVGRDLMSDASSLVVFSNRSWISDKGSYNALTEIFTSSTDEDVDVDYIDEINRLLNQRFTFSTLILEKDYYSKLYLD